MFSNLLSNIKIRTVSAYATGIATTALNTDIVDMTGFDGVVFLLNRGASHATGRSLKAQHMDTSTGGGAQDLAGSAVTSKNKESIVGIDIYRPQKRYVRAVVDTGPAMQKGSIIAIQYSGRDRPTAVSDADKGITQVILNSPSSGSA
jgi:hypothetical protein